MNVHLLVCSAVRLFACLVMLYICAVCVFVGDVVYLSVVLYFKSATRMFACSLVCLSVVLHVCL